MSSSSTGAGTHAGGASSQPAATEPTFAERARTLMYLSRVGTLSTVSRRQPGFPYGSVMPYGLDREGRPTFLISTLAMHTQNLQADPRSSLLVTQADSGDPLAGSRVTLLGNSVPLTEPEIPEARELYLTRYANSRHWVDFQDFSFYRMDPVDVYYVGGFGKMGWLTADDYRRAQPDPLADSGAGIMQHMNADHRVALMQLARRFAGIESTAAEMTAVDRLGFQVQLETKDGTRTIRIAFLRPANTPSEAREVLIEMVGQARVK